MSTQLVTTVNTATPPATSDEAVLRETTLTTGAFLGDGQEQSSAITKARVETTTTAARDTSSSHPASLPRIAFSRNFGGTIWVMDVDGSNQQQLTTDYDNYGEYPFWSPDGTRIAYPSGDSIWVMNSDGTDPVQIADNSPDNDRLGYDRSALVWSPDGSLIAYLRFGDLWVANTVGINSDPRWVTDDVGYIAWSPDSRQIAVSESFLLS